MKIPFLKLPKQAEKRNRIMGLLIGLLVAAAFGVIYREGNTGVPVLSSIYDFLMNLEYKMYDRRFQIRGPLDSKHISKDIVLLDYDDESQEWNPFPPDRSYYSDVVNALGEHGAKARAMFFDIFFVDPFGRRLLPNATYEFPEKFDELKMRIAYDSESLVPVQKEMMGQVADLLSGAPGLAQIQKAGELLEELAKNQDAKFFTDYYIEVLTYLKENRDLHTLAPDWDLVLRNSITSSKNVFLAQTVEDLEKTKYSVDGLLYDPDAHKLFARMIVKEDRTRTQNRTELNMNATIGNLMAPDYDRLLNAGRASGRRPLPFSEKERASIRYEMAQLKAQTTMALKLNKPFSFGIGANAPVSREELTHNYRTLRKISPLNTFIVEHATGIGYVKPELQKDGIIRMAAPVLFFQGRLYPHIALVLIMRYFDVTQKDTTFYKDKIVLRNCKRPGKTETETITIPLYKGRNFLVNWAGRYSEHGQFQHRSFKLTYESAVKYNLLKKQERGEDLMEQELMALDSMTDEDKRKAREDINFFKGKIVFTGLTASDTHDLNPIPFHERYPLIGMHANLVNTAINKIFIHTTPYPVYLLILFALGLGIGFVGGTAKQFPGAMATLGAIFGYGLVCVLVFNYARIWLPFIPVVATLIFVYLFVLVYRFMTEGQEAKKMKSMFSTYVNPEVVDTLIANPDMLRLGGQRMELTAMFALASGPGLQTEDAEILVDRLNEYFTAMTEEIFRYNGTLDKYEGAIIMAVYGAPVQYDDHAVKACLSCVGMRQALDKLKEEWARQGKEPIKTTVGVNSGPMIAGNMGSASRFNYTIMGDSVNLAARILGAANQYGIDYTISEYTYDRASDLVITRMVDDIVVVGKTEPIKIYQVIGSTQEPMADYLKKLKEHYEEGFRLYTERRWDEAIAAFRRTLEAVPDDTPSQLLIARCEQYKAEPPADTWKGEFVLTSKGL